MPNETLSVQVNIKGPLFSERIDDTVRRALVEEALDKVDERVRRIPRKAKLGVSRNTMDLHRSDSGGDPQMEITSTLNWPRTKGTTWLKYWAGSEYNQGVIRRLVKNVIRKAGRRIAQDLGGK